MISAIFTPINIVFITIIVWIFVIAVYQGITNGRNNVIVQASPNLLTSIGVFGTFLGIFIGLWGFDVNNIDESVPKLLAGMKTAFFSSVLGMGASVLLRPVSLLFKASGDDEEKGVDILLSEIKSSIIDLNKAFSGNNDESLITQVQKLRNNVNDNSKDLQKIYSDKMDQQIYEFKIFADKMVENNSNALIEALEQVIKDFNVKISEQFGDNFKMLNSAVENMIEWQDAHKQNMEALQERINTAVSTTEKNQQSLEVCSATLADISSEAQKIPTTLEALSSAVEIAHTSTNGMIEALGGLADLKDKATSAVPEIQKNIDSLLEQLSTSVETVGLQMTSTHEKSAARLEETINQSFEKFDQQMQAELTRALQQLGSQLGSISEKLASDYDNFAGAANVVLKAANGVGR